MKGIRIKTTIAAIAIATISVYGTHRNNLAKSYYRSLNNGGTNCDIPVIPGPICTEGSYVQCKITLDGIFLVWVIDTSDSGGCTPYLTHSPFAN